MFISLHIMTSEGTLSSSNLIYAVTPSSEFLRINLVGFGWVCEVYSGLFSSQWTSIDLFGSLRPCLCIVRLMLKTYSVSQKKGN